MELLEQLARYLESNGLGTYRPSSVGGTIFINVLPDAPDQAVALIQRGGSAPPHSKMPYDVQGVQLFIRGGPDPIAAMEYANQFSGVLHGFGNAKLEPSGYYILRIQATQSTPSAIGSDVSGRYEFSQNYTIETEVPSRVRSY